jgi:hypothetical protein
MVFENYLAQKYYPGGKKAGNYRKITGKLPKKKREGHSRQSY